MNKKEYYKYLKDNNLILFQAIVGSTAYGTNIETSDKDIKFIYIEPIEKILTFKDIEQLEVTKDFVGYEIGRYLELLEKANPNLGELIFSEKEMIQIEHPSFREHILDNKEKFICKKAYKSFGKYAVSQIKKAKGQNKKINKPFSKEKKGVLDFCWTNHHQKTIALKGVLEKLKERHTINDTNFAATALPHMKNCFNLYITNKEGKGIFNKKNTQVLLSSVDKEAQPELLFSFNLEGYQKYCKDYKEYWHWKKVYNKERFTDKFGNELDFNAKNMMHCIRLIETCIELLDTGKINVRRSNTEYLKDIRNGLISYDDIMKKCIELQIRLETSYKNTLLPESIDPNFINEVHLLIRKEFYKL